MPQETLIFYLHIDIAWLVGGRGIRQDSEPVAFKDCAKLNTGESVPRCLSSVINSGQEKLNSF